MAFREVRVVEIRELLRLWLKGESLRSIGRLVGVHRQTVVSYVEAAQTGKFLHNGERIFEVPIRYRARSRAEGKKLRWTDGVQALWILSRVRLFGR